MAKRSPIMFFPLSLLILLGCTQSDETHPYYEEPLPDLLQGWKTASWTPFTVGDSITGFAGGPTSEGFMYTAVSSTGIIGYSLEGSVWRRAKEMEWDSGDPPKEVILPPGVSYKGVAYGGGYFIAVGDKDTIAVSRDGRTWERKKTTVFGSGTIHGIAYGEIRGTGYFVVAGSNTPPNSNIAYSANGGKDWQWVNVSPVTSPSRELRTVVYGEGAFYLAGEGGHTIKTSDPLGTWTHYQYTAAPINTGTITKAVFGSYAGSSALGVVFNDGEGKDRRIAIIPAESFGVNNNWDGDLDLGYFGGNTIKGIAYYGGAYMAAGSGARIGYWPSSNPSKDRYWRVLTLHEFYYWEITAAAVMDKQFYVGGIGGKIAHRKWGYL